MLCFRLICALVMEHNWNYWKQFVALCILVFLSSLTISSTDATTFTVANSCAYTVWPGLLTGAGRPPLANGGFALKSGQSMAITMPESWSGRLWGRTGCKFSSAGVGNCTSGDCAGRLQCSGAGATPPVSLVEFTLQGNGVARDFYDVSLVDGYNLPVSVTPRDKMNGTCGVAGCSADINKRCPSDLQVLDSGDVVACKSACLAFQEPQYCCSGAFGNPSTCKPTSYSKIFKAACPNAYSYAYDDPTSIYTCSGANYTITFCPASSNLQLCCPHKHRTRSTSSTTIKKRPGILWVFCVGLFGWLASPP